MNAIWFLGGMGPPIDEWKKILDEMNSRTRKLEEDYELTAIQKKVEILSKCANLSGNVCCKLWCKTGFGFNFEVVLVL